MESQQVELNNQSREITRLSNDIRHNIEGNNPEQLFKLICEMEQRCRNVVLILDDEYCPVADKM
jgi:hypothetical protein